MPVRIHFKKPLLMASACSYKTPTITSIPASFNRLIPLPATLGLGSCIATTTRVIPAFINASAQGGVRPK